MLPVEGARRAGWVHAGGLAASSIEKARVGSNSWAVVCAKRAYWLRQGLSHWRLHRSDYIAIMRTRVIWPPDCGTGKGHFARREESRNKYRDIRCEGNRHDGRSNLFSAGETQNPMRAHGQVLDTDGRTL